MLQGLKVKAQVGSLTKKVHKIINTRSRSTCTSYGLRLLNTASGTRAIVPSANSKIDASSLKEIDPSSLGYHNSLSLGSGRFGTCRTASYYDYNVCIKTMNDDSQELFLHEAYFINVLGCHKNLPFLLGIMKATKSIVMSCHLVNNLPLKMYDAVNNGSDDFNHTKMDQLHAHCCLNYSMTEKNQNESVLINLFLTLFLIFLFL